VPCRSLDARVRNYRGVTMVAGPTQALELSETAAFVWRSLDEGRSVAAIAALMADAYDVDERTAGGDVVELLTELAAVGVVTY
jgi:hypothetical protein